MSDLNAVYSERNKLIALVAKQAIALGHQAGLLQDGDAAAPWQHVVVIDLPSGQVSWHIHDNELYWFAFLGAYEQAWDGHTTEQKYNRVLSAVYPAPLANPVLQGGSVPTARGFCDSEISSWQEIYVENSGVML